MAGCRGFGVLIRLDVDDATPLRTGDIVLLRQTVVSHGTLASQHSKMEARNRIYGRTNSLITMTQE